MSFPLVVIAFGAVVLGVGWVLTWRSAAQHAREHAQLKQSLGVVDVDRRVLELVAGGASVQTVLDTLTRSIEKLATDVHCTILLLDEDGNHLRKGAGPSIPSSYLDAVDGLEIG